MSGLYGRQVTAHFTGLGITVATATTRDHNGIGPSVLPRVQPKGAHSGLSHIVGQFFSVKYNFREFHIFGAFAKSKFTKFEIAKSVLRGKKRPYGMTSGGTSLTHHASCIHYTSLVGIVYLLLVKTRVRKQLYK